MKETASKGREERECEGMTETARERGESEGREGGGGSD